MKITKAYLDVLTYEIIGCAIEVHRQLGPGLLEKVYEKCLVQEILNQGYTVEQQQVVPIFYKNTQLDAELRYDLMVENLIILEIKAVEKIHPLFEAQLLTYLRLLNKPKGIILNFNCTNIFREGQKTMVTPLYSQLPDA